MGVEGENPNDLTFWYWAARPNVIVPALECALARVRAATCLPVDISFDARVWVRERPAADLAPRIGQSVSGNTRIVVSDQATNPCNVLTHEIGQHVLRARADHVDGDINYLSPNLVAAICARHTCGCQNPETP